MFNGKIILLTGGTGSFGTAFVRQTLGCYNPKKIIIFSRDEMKQWEMRHEFKNDSRIMFVIGDVRDREKVHSVMRGVDFVVHAAATKIVPTSEENPSECIKTNIIGAMNVIDAALDAQVLKVVALSTDKACNPINLYGATKLASDKLFTAAGGLSGEEAKTIFCVVRYGNVMGSRGSVIPYFRSLEQSEPFPVTDKRMTRFMISLKDGVGLVWRAFSEMRGGEIFVKKIPSIKIMDIAAALDNSRPTNIIGIRAGEKLHEEMISVEDSLFTYEFDDHFKILRSSGHDNVDEIIDGGVKVRDGFNYSSDTNDQWMSAEDLQLWLSNNDT